MAIAVDPNKPFDYVLKSDRKLAEGAKPTRWKLKPLTVKEQTELRDGIVAYHQDGKEMSGRMLGGTVELKTLRLGLVGCEDFYDADGAAIPFEAEPDSKRNPSRFFVTDAFLSRISRADRTELADAIVEVNTLSEDDEKN